MVRYPGASAFLLGGITAYDNRIKTSVLGVKEETLRIHGAVSRQTVLEMVKGLERLFHGDVMAAVSGVAGPDGGTDAKPVGTVDMAFMVRGELSAERMCFDGNRETIIRSCVRHVCSRLAELISMPV